MLAIIGTLVLTVGNSYMVWNWRSGLRRKAVFGAIAVVFGLIAVAIP